MVPSYHDHNPGIKSGQLDDSDEDKSNPAPHTKSTIPDTFSSTTSDSELPERENITCQPSTVVEEAVSGESLHRSETTPIPVHWPQMHM